MSSRPAKSVIPTAPVPVPEAFPGQTELFTAYRYHAVFTDSPFELPQAEADHRRDAVIEQVIAEGKAGPWLTCPRGTSRPTRPG